LNPLTYTVIHRINLAIVKQLRSLRPVYSLPFLLSIDMLYNHSWFLFLLIRRSLKTFHNSQLSYSLIEKGSVSGKKLNLELFHLPYR